MIAVAVRNPLAFAASLCALLLLAAPARANPLDPDLPSNVILADLGLHVIGIGYQRTLSPWLALQLDAESYSPWTQNDNLLGASVGYESDLKGWVVRFRPFFMGLFETAYPAGGPPRGFWFSPFVQAGIATATRDSVKQTGNVWAIGASVGWGWLFWDHLSLLLGIGGQYHVANIPDNMYPPSFARPYPTLDANLGWAF